jgi:hypothetical protein
MEKIILLSRVRGSVTNNNGFWIRWLDSLALHYNYTINDCLRLAPFLTGLRVISLPLWRMKNEEFLATESLNSPDWTDFQATPTEITASNNQLSFRLTRYHENVCQPRGNALAFTSVSVAAETRVREPLASNGLAFWLHYSGSQALLPNRRLATVILVTRLSSRMTTRGASINSGIYWTL